MDLTPPKPSPGLFIIVLIVIVIGAAAVFMGTSEVMPEPSPSSLPSDYPSPTPLPIITYSPTPGLLPTSAPILPTPSPTNNLITHQNTEHGYSLSYPSDWVDVTSKFKGNDLVLESPSTAIYAKQPSVTDLLPDFEITYYDSVKYLPTNSGKNTYTTLVDYLYGEKGTPPAIDYTAQKVGIYDGYAVTIGGTSSYPAYFIERNGHVYRLAFPSTSAPSVTLSAEATAILSSFMFTN